MSNERALSAIQKKRLFGLCALVIVSSLILGGGTRPGFLSDVILQLLAVPLLLMVLWHALDIPATKQMRFAYAFCFTLVSIPLIQLMPLPPELWSALPNREPIISSFDLINRALPWMPISVSPHATWLSLLSLIPPVSIFLAVLLLGYRERCYLSLFILAIGIINVFLGLTQVAQGPESVLRFFDYTNPTEAVGFFANRNHYSALLYSVMLFASAWLIAEMRNSDLRTETNRFDTAKILILLAGFTVIVAFVGAQTIARSRGGLALTIVALIGIVALSVSGGRRGSGSERPSLFKITPGKLVSGATVLAVIFATQFALYRIMERFAQDPLQDARIPFTRNTLEAAQAYIPFGSGMGSFVAVYGMFEKSKDALAGAYANRAHNDWAELWLETGGLGAMLMAVFVIWLIMRAIKVWRRSYHGTPEINQGLAKAATLVIFLLLAHSFVDYPLRTGAILAIFAFACAILVDPPKGDEGAKANLVSDNAHIRDNPYPSLQTAPETAPIPVDWPEEAPHGPAASSPTAWPQEPQAPAPPSGNDSESPWLDEMDWPDEWRDQTRQKKPHEDEN